MIDFVKNWIYKILAFLSNFYLSGETRVETFLFFSRRGCLRGKFQFNDTTRNYIYILQLRSTCNIRYYEVNI